MSVPRIRIALRADTSKRIGRGHITRSLALGFALKSLGADVRLVTRKFAPGLAVLSASYGVRHIWLPAPRHSTVNTGREGRSQAWGDVGWKQDAEQVVRALSRWKPQWVVVDNYDLDQRWHRSVRLALSARIAVIDDLADRKLDADLLIDHNPHANHRRKYSGKIGGSVRVLGGSRFALLGPAYRSPRPFEVRRKVKSVGVFMGGADTANLSSTAIRVCREDLNFDGPIEVVTTALNQNVKELGRVARKLMVGMRIDLPELSRFFQRHDLQIGAGGGASWERSSIGVPSVLLQAAENQSAVLAALRAHHAAVVVRHTGPDLRRRLASAVRVLLKDRRRRELLCVRSRALVDGRGAERVAVCLMASGLQIRRGSSRDARLIFQWRNHSSIRSKSSNSRKISWSEHRQWLNRYLRSKNHHLLIGMIGTRSVGVVRLDETSDSIVEVSIYLDPGLQGLGLGTQLLASAEDFYLERKGVEKQFVARVLAGNRASKALFSGAGYRYTRGLWRKPARSGSDNCWIGVRPCR